MQYVVHHSCVYSDLSKQNQEDPWTSPRDYISADASLNFSKDTNANKRPLREKNPKNIYKHVPHKEKAPQVVARRNARERKRVQAVNMAFVRLRKAIPYQHSRGKRISKVKTLHSAIRYIQELEIILQNTELYKAYCKNEKCFNFEFAEDDFYDSME